ncbi:MAG: sigma-54-dependent Fis family transcriptional regulator [Myxococcota bacterium]
MTLSQTAMTHARRLLHEHGQVATDLLDPFVARSWLRSRTAGLAPDEPRREVPHLSAFELQQALELRRELLTHAAPVVDYLRAQMRDTGSSVVLADHRGLLLRSLGDAKFLSRAEQVALAPGASWHEHDRGTNAIGTALAEQAAVSIHGREHYVDRHGFLTCTAAPILAPDGRVVGVLDVSGEQHSRRLQTPGLVRAAARMVENGLFHARHGHQLVLRFHVLVQALGTGAEGYLAISDSGQIAGANAAAIALLGAEHADIYGKHLEDWLDVRLARLHAWGREQPPGAHTVEVRGGALVQLRVDRPAPVAVAVPSRPTRLPARDALAELDTGDPRLAEAVERARRVANKPIALLIQGETGVGKELFARAAHDSGPRRRHPFVALNCAALPESLIEAELFGYAAGAFTGARKAGSLGHIRQADGGTLFLDEIGDMPLGLQARLLRVLQERQVTPLGGARPIAVEFSLICATHRQLKQQVAAGLFRADLYYRIQGLPLTLPPLRERTDLAALIVRILAEASPTRVVIVDPAVTTALAGYGWPGNVRELAGALHTACALLDDDEFVIGWQHLPDELRSDLSIIRPIALLDTVPLRGDAPSNLRSLSDSAIRRVVVTVQGNMSEAARRLGISRNTLYRRLKGLETGDPPA